MPPTVTKVNQNGLAEPVAMPGQRSQLTPPRIERWLDVPDYPGYRVKLWINYPRHLRSAFQLPEGLEDLEGDALEAVVSERKALVEQAMAAIVLDHNGWPDQDGNVLPHPTDPTLWELIDQHLMNVVLALAFQAPSQLPNSLLPTRRK